MHVPDVRFRVYADGKVDYLIFETKALVIHGSEAIRRPRCGIVIARVAVGAWHPGTPAGAGLIGVALTHPAAIVAREKHLIGCVACSRGPLVRHQD
jgi:hypothetical protein